MFLGGDKWLWVHMGWNRLFFGVSSGYGFFWVVFWWLRLVLGGQKWLLAVMSGYQVFVFGSCLENAILTTSPPYKMSLPDKTSILPNLHPDKMSILTKHTFLTKRLLTFSQHKSWTLKHGGNSVIQINHASTKFFLHKYNLWFLWNIRALMWWSSYLRGSWNINFQLLPFRMFMLKINFFLIVSFQLSNISTSCCIVFNFSLLFLAICQCKVTLRPDIDGVIHHIWELHHVINSKISSL